MAHHSDWVDRKPHQPLKDEIYKKAEYLYIGTADWKMKVERRLRLSKAFRCLVIPLALIFACDYWPNFLPRLSAPKNLFAAFTFLTLPRAKWLSLTACLVFGLAYLYLRLAHMEALYRLIAERADLKRTKLQFEPQRPEETLYVDGCLFFISSTELRQALACGTEDHRLATLLLERGAGAIP